MKMAFLAPPKIQGVVAWYQGSSGVLGVLAFFFNRSYQLVQSQDCILEGEQEYLGMKRRGEKEY